MGRSVKGISKEFWDLNIYATTYQPVLSRSEPWTPALGIWEYFQYFCPQPRAKSLMMGYIHFTASTLVHAWISTWLVGLTSHVCGCMNSESRDSWQGSQLDGKKERLLLLRAVRKGFYIWQSIETGVTRHFARSLLTRAEWGVRRSRPLVKFYYRSSPSYVLVLKRWNQEKTQNTLKPGLELSGKKIYVSGDKKIYEVF